MTFGVATQSNWTKGLIASTGKMQVVRGSVTRNSNMVYTERGSLKTCDGTKLYGVVAPGIGYQGPGLNQEWCVAMLSATRGRAGMFPLAVGLNQNGQFNPYDLNGGALGGFALPTTIAPAGSYRLPQLVNANDNVIICAGNDTPPGFWNFYTSTVGSLGNLVNPVPGAAHGIYHNGFVWLWNTAPAISGIDGPSSLRMCTLSLATGAVPDLTSFPATQQVFVDANDGTQGQGMIAFTSAEAGIAPTSTLVLFKDFTTYQATGLLSPSGAFVLTKAQTDMGCVAPRSIQFAPGLGIIRLTHMGVTMFNGADDTLISEEISPYLFQQEPDIVPMDWSRVSQASACITTTPPMYVVAIPLPSIQGCSRLLCYDLILKAWTIIDLPVPVASGAPLPNSNFAASMIATFKLPNLQPTTVITPYAPGLVNSSDYNNNNFARRWQYGDTGWGSGASTTYTTDSILPVSWRARGPEVFAKNPSSKLYFRRVILRSKAYASNVAATVRYSGVSQQTITSTKTFQYLAAFSLYGSCRYGSAVYGGGQPDLILPPIDLGVVAYSANAEYAGSGAAELLAMDWHVNERPVGSFSRFS